MASSSRAPNPTVLWNSAPVPGLLTANVDANNHAGADRFRLVLSADLGSWVWSATSSDTIDIQVSVDDQGNTSLIVGSIDSVEADVIAGTIEVSGRDLTARFLAAPIEESFDNQVASEIVTLLALRRGLTPMVTATSDLVGRYYENDHARLTFNQFARACTEWDLLVWLAQTEGFEVWVQGTSLFFSPATTSWPTTIISPDMCADLRVSRNCAITSGITVAVKTWDCRGQEARSITASLLGGNGGTPNYVILKPNLDPSAAQVLAQQTAIRMAVHSQSLEFTVPGETGLAPRTTILLSGTGTPLDGPYVITDVHRSLSFESGFHTRVTARLPEWTIS